MIKEDKEKRRKNKKLELKQELIGYVKTAGVSFVAAAIFTLLLSLHARSDMIKNLYANKNERLKLEREAAKQITAHSDFTASLNESSYPVCLQVGNLYEAAGDFNKAEYAYYLAVKKAPEGVYTPYYKLAVTLIELNKIKDAEELIASVNDTNDLHLIRFKTRINIVLGDKYFSEGKYLKAAEHYEKSEYYYSRLKKQDKIVKNSIEKRLVEAYIEAADVIVQNGYNSDAVRFLKKALKYDPENDTVKYRLAIIYADLDPVKSVEYFETLMENIPQEIDYDAYNRALMKAATIKDIEGNSIQAKVYRYRMHSLDLFVNQKVVYKNDIDTTISSFEVKKILFRYRLKPVIQFTNNSARDIFKMNAEFVLRQNDKPKETIVINCVNKNKPLYSNGGTTEDITFTFGKNIFTKKDLNSYYIDIYLYKDDKYKTFMGSFKVPEKSFYTSD